MSGMGGLALIRVELNSILLVTLLALLQEKQLVSNSCYKKCLKNRIYKIKNGNNKFTQRSLCW